MQWFDGFDFDSEGWLILCDDCVVVYVGLEFDLCVVFDLVVDCICVYYVKQCFVDSDWIDVIGICMGVCWMVVEVVGLYVFGGCVVYLLLVLMNVIFVKVVGVE